MLCRWALFFLIDVSSLNSYNVLYTSMWLDPAPHPHSVTQVRLSFFTYTDRLLICLPGSSIFSYFTLFFKYGQNYFLENKLDHVNFLKSLKVLCLQKQDIKHDNRDSSQWLIQMVLHILFLVSLPSFIYYQFSSFVLVLCQIFCYATLQ